jgi:hypothetical protein
VLDELSRSRARDGFTPSETALSVFSLKEAVYELVAESADLVPEYIAFSRVIDDLSRSGYRVFPGWMPFPCPVFEARGRKWGAGEDRLAASPADRV